MVDQIPSAAERARTVLAAATSLSVTAGRRRVHLSGRHATDPAGRTVLDLPPDSGLGAAVAGGREPSLVEVTDVAPVAMRRRVRAQLTLTGWLEAAPAGNAAEHGRRLLFTPVTGRLVEGPGGRVTDVAGAALAAALPDPLAASEADLLCHFGHAHRDVVDRLTRLIPADRLPGVTAVHPLRLDRYGIVLRLEFPRLDRDVRLPFGTPLAAAADAPGRLLDLLAGAHRCPRRAR